MIHPSAEVSKDADIGKDSNIWHQAQVRENAKIGDRCNIGKNVYIDFEVTVGSGVKIQNNVSIYHGVTIEDDVFVGPSVVFTNDLRPRAFSWDESMVETTLVKKGASIGANSTIICGDRIIGEYAMVAAGSVVTRNVPDHGLVMGNPARLKGFVCKCGEKLELREEGADHAIMRCNKCQEEAIIPKQDYILNT
jgi:acetyltransferase-like isoleucine patch superfamily enzyme